VRSEGEMARGAMMVGMLVEGVGELAVGSIWSACYSSRDVNTVIVCRRDARRQLDLSGCNVSLGV
jgi:hypothetical protein